MRNSIHELNQKLVKIRPHCFMSILSKKQVVELARWYTYHYLPCWKGKLYSNEDACEVTGYKTPFSINRHIPVIKADFINTLYFDAIAPSLSQGIGGKEVELTNVSKKSRRVSVNGKSRQKSVTCILMDLSVTVHLIVTRN